MSSALSDCIRDGTFPESNDILTQEITSEGLSELLNSIDKSKNELKDDIRDVGRNTAGDVDTWIAQAGKLQEDIARCKDEARSIVEEHQRLQSLKHIVEDAKNKTQLLEAEISFTLILEHEIKNVADIKRILDGAEKDLVAQNVVQSVNKLKSVEMIIKDISAPQSRYLLKQIDHDLRQKSQKQLEHIVREQFAATSTENTLILIIRSDTEIQQSQSSEATPTTLKQTLSALQDLQALPSAIEIISQTINSFVLPLVSSRSAPYITTTERTENQLKVIRKSVEQDPYSLLAALQSFLTFLYDRLPDIIRNDVAHHLLGRINAFVISQWLEPALPSELHELDRLQPLQKEVRVISNILRKYAWPGYEDFEEWSDQIPRIWLTKRRIASLEAVRKAFSSAQGELRPVERVERQTITSTEPKDNSEAEDDGWNASWEEETENDPSAASSTEKVEEDTSGWDFDTDDDTASANKVQEQQTENKEEDAGDAWGWGDDDDNDADKSQLQEQVSPDHSKSNKLNGETVKPARSHDMVLTETYYITDIPDYILEIIGKDIADSHELDKTASGFFGSSAPATGLAGVPTLVLALFRAIAPTFYSTPSVRYSLSNINLYNDTLYLIQKLNETPDAILLQPSIQSLTKLARQAYSSELDTQRTILADLLDGAQGFDRCTTFPNSQACIDAIASTTDRLRQLHRDWSSVLGESHLLQSLGSLITMIFGKIIKDIEDMDDISEAESKQLVTFCQQVLSIEDLFTSKLPNLIDGSSSSDQATKQQEKPPSQILLYVPNYLRFQYLQQILESSLVDIKYLWTEGEMSLEFSVDEVVDLIKALFAESQYRRDAIRAIKGAGH